MRRMTLARALDIVRRRTNVPRGLRAFIQDLRKQVHTGKRLRSRLRAGGFDLESTRKSLNHLTQEAIRKLDLEQIQCSEFEIKQALMVEEARRDVEQYNAQASAARGKILSAEAAIDKIQKEQARIGEALRMHKQKCQVDGEATKRQQAVVKDNLVMMEKVVASMDCTESGMTALIQCQGRRAGTSFLTFSHHTLRRTVAGMRSSAQRALRKGLSRALEQSAAAAAFADKGLPGEMQQLGEIDSSRPDDPLEPLDIVTNTSDSPTSRRKQQRKCSIRGEPDCEFVLDKLLQIQTEMVDKVDELKEELQKVESNCKDVRDNYNAQLEGSELRLKDSQTALAEGVTMQTSVDEQSRLKALQVSRLTAEHQQTMAECKANLVNFENEICGVKKIRAELSAMAGDHAFIQDCEVSAWTPDDCPVTCGGGVQKLTRVVLALNGQGGAECPPLEMVRGCSEQPCPVSCRLSDWSRWSSCTARCGGGVRQRARTVLQEPMNGGLACGQTIAEEGCNLHSCDRDCELIDWSEWSECSKMCNGGLRVRRKEESVPALGSGACPDLEGPARLEYRSCNNHACLLAPGRSTLQCASKLDVIVLLDGSASLQEAGWKAMKEATLMLVKAFQGDAEVRLGLVLFSGPRNFDAYMRCTHKEEEAGGHTPDPALDCGISWVSHLTEDIETVVQQIVSLSWPKATSLTSAALTATLAELRQARADARSVVVVLTDGKPMSPRLTGQAAAMVRKRARLVWVPVTRFAPLEETRSWSSKPVRENVIEVWDFQTLEKPETISVLISNICPKVK